MDIRRLKFRPLTAPFFIPLLAFSAALCYNMIEPTRLSPAFLISSEQIGTSV